ncbi:MAG TPA: class I SAM-dependent methyltransferase, partial [Geminicoccaceae bacterium]|nr:class I SAM-dependent methyltransferase [Geminicoccaceae bacterium]
MALVRRLTNLARFGIGERAREKKRLLKAELRQKVFESELWDKTETFAHRQYGSYDEYLAHQSSKLAQISERLHETEAEDLAEFERRFGGCAALQGMRNVLCLGARLGTEVRALHKLGLFAVGIDLNPGPENPYVLVGDFHALVFPTGSVDVVYTNVLDHAFDLEKLTAEIRRVLHPNGVFLADVLAGYDEGFTPGEFEAMHWRSIETLAGQICRVGGF